MTKLRNLHPKSSQNKKDSFVIRLTLREFKEEQKF